MALSNLTNWPRKRGGIRRRASARRAVRRARFHRRAGWIGRVILLVVVAVPSLFLTSPYYLSFADRLPEPDRVVTAIPTDTILYASDGTTVLADLHPPGYQHYQEPMAAMGHLLPDAVIAIEDRNFYQEPGVDPSGVLRASMVDWRAHHSVEGASTITQQLVKLRLVGNEASLDRKMREALLAFEIERRYSKTQILELYLNSVFFGNSAWGSEAAAHIYFHKETKDLDLAQASMLAGIIRGPTLYNPLVNWESARARQAIVLKAMVREGMVTPMDAAKAYVEDISPPTHMFTPATQVVAPGFVRYVTAELTSKYGPEVTYKGGLRVLTTLNPQLQNIAQSAISNTVASLWSRNVSQGALVAIDPTSGAIVAMVGSANPNGSGGQYNLAVWPPRNPGSSMKIFTYTAAIESGKYTMTTPVTDSAFTYRDPVSGEAYTPRNYDGRYHGTLQLQQCMGNSLNIPAVKVELGIGVSSVVSLARRMGAPPYQQHSDQNGNPAFTTDDAFNTYGPSLTLGGYGETPLQMATAGSVLAAQGVLHPPFAIAAVSSGPVVMYVHSDAGAQRVLDARVAFIMEQIMSDDTNRQLIFGRGSLLTLPGRHVGVKTGTSDSFADAWTVGYTPHLVAAIWTGNPDWRQKMTANSDSIVVAAPAWHAFMQSALDAMGMGDEWFGEPAGLDHRSVGGKLAYYLPGTH